MTTTTTTPTIPKPKPPSILTLPAEIRNQIWRELTLHPHPLDVAPHCEPSFSKLHQPAIAFTNHQIRREVLTLHYSENTFHLGKIGYHAPTDIKLHAFDQRLTRWHQLLGPYTRHLTHLTLAVDARCYAWGDRGPPDEDARYEMRVVRDGEVAFVRNGRPRCTCRLKRGVAVGASRDGAVLLEVMREYGGTYREQGVHEGVCERCGKGRLEVFGRAEVRHLPLWEDITTM